MVDSDGSLRHWHATSGQLMAESVDDHELDLQLLHVTYAPKGDQFVTCASDNNIRVYDGHTHRKVFSSSNL
jgi:WD40 repeat protein